MPLQQHAENQGEVVGLDTGLTSLAVLSNGEKFDPPHSLKQNLKKLRRANKALARKQLSAQAHTALNLRNYAASCAVKPSGEISSGLHAAIKLHAGVTGLDGGRG